MVAHPLDPLSPTEFQSTAAILRRDQGVTDSWRFASIELKEPAKADVKAWKQGDAVPRRSLSVLWDRESNQTYEAVVDLVGDRVDRGLTSRVFVPTSPSTSITTSITPCTSIQRCLPDSRREA